MRTRTRRATDQELVEFILNYLAGSRAKNGRESVSYLVETIRGEGGLAFPTNHSAAMDEFERLGFTIERIYTDSAYRSVRQWNVTV